MVIWAIEQIRDPVTDEDLEQKLGEWLAVDYCLFSLSEFTEPVVEELLTQIRDWLSAVNSQRLAEGRLELRPSLS
ncbi:hypothetical protein LWP59_06505 [Amycolatopsis acidiphila]|uniref:Uncharacterized protein n=1 Tax=Amycolatopsis acidiphila TaxID=715473 RepID=A0A558AAF8_9PSEU|nr:hypothetical protein [Amycolatopsis acidiphila]TVT21260.1 hypothetical protein FNH06_17865 [Amycolatopsis acidiphila]UIJ61279.1 hypothetical protein LWP59_06505 [Amycolatopsis acidiphila]GHG78468.1 hypothetical protein GCM10017788_45650 [Amycolatopsis acidiphila]